MTAHPEGDLTRDLINSARRISDNELMRERFIMGLAEPPFCPARLSASDNLLADILADPELAEALWSFLPSALSLDRPGKLTGSPANILPWGHKPIQAQISQNPITAENNELRLLKDFWGKAAALMAGAAIAGAAGLEEQYLYTHCLDGRPIIVEERENFHLDASGIRLPRQAANVLVLGFVRDPKVMGMNPGLAKLRPAKGWLSWGEQARAALWLADWISAQGYLALPSAGGLLLAGHHGVLAGLGELGRQGLLISPEYGPNLRLFTIITDYPFSPGQPFIFGVANYCETCQRCITECPAKALAEGRRRPGLFQWPVDRRACLNNWLEKKDPCRKCIEVCPYTREPLVGSRGGTHRPPPA